MPVAIDKEARARGPLASRPPDQPQHPASTAIAVVEATANRARNASRAPVEGRLATMSAVTEPLPATP